MQRRSVRLHGHATLGCEGVEEATTQRGTMGLPGAGLGVAQGCSSGPGKGKARDPARA